MKGVALKRIRQFHMLSQAELSKRLCISQAYLSQLENNNRNPSDALAKKIKEQFYLSPEFFE